MYLNYSNIEISGFLTRFRVKKVGLYQPGQIKLQVDFLFPAWTFICPLFLPVTFYFPLEVLFPYWRSLILKWTIQIMKIWSSCFAFPRLLCPRWFAAVPGGIDFYQCFCSNAGYWTKSSSLESLFGRSRKQKFVCL